MDKQLKKKARKVKVKSTFVIEEELLIKLKTAAVKSRKSYSELIEELIRGGLKG